MDELATDKVANVEVNLEEKAEVSPEKSKRKLKFCLRRPDSKSCRKIVFITISTVTILTALALIAVTVMTSLATKIYDVEQSNRLVGMVVLAATAAVAISILIYSNVGVYQKKKKPLHAMRLVLLTLVIIQSLISSLAVTMNETDVEGFSKSLGNSFQLAVENNQRHMKLWSATQHELSCCGVTNPNDYRNPKTPNYFPPNIPISCCPSFDPNRSPLVQEKEREVCRAQRSYYQVGCLTLVIKAFQDTSFLVLGVAINLIIFELFCVICASIIIKKNKDIKISEEGVLTNK